MAKALVLGFVVAFAASSGAQAQASASRPEAHGGPVHRTGNITSVGETVPNPGMPQSDGTTSLDRKIQSEDARIDNSICKGC